MILYWLLVPVALLQGIGVVAPCLNEHLNRYLGAVNSSLLKQFASCLQLAGWFVIRTFIILTGLFGEVLVKRTSRRLAPALGLDLAMEEKREFLHLEGDFQVDRSSFALHGSIAGALLVWQVFVSKAAEINYDYSICTWR